MAFILNFIIDKVGVEHMCRTEGHALADGRVHSYF